MIAPEGWPFVLIPAFAGVVITIFGAPYPGWALIGAAGVVLALLRDPERTFAGSSEELCAPVDGRVMSIGEETTDDGQRQLHIGVTWHDTHVARAPSTGIVDEVCPRPRGVRLTWRTAHGRLALTLDGRRFTAATIAPQAGNRAERGERLGLLPLGGHASLDLPSSYRLLVKPGDRVRAGHTPVAAVV